MNSINWDEISSEIQEEMGEYENWQAIDSDIMIQTAILEGVFV